MTYLILKMISYLNVFLGAKKIKTFCWLFLIALLWRLEKHPLPSVFHLREDHCGITLTDDIEIHFMELSKLNEQMIPNEGGLLNWLLFLKSENTDSWEVLKLNEPGLEKAMTALEYLSQDAEARACMRCDKNTYMTKLP